MKVGKYTYGIKRNNHISLRGGDSVERLNNNPIKIKKDDIIKIFTDK